MRFYFRKCSDTESSLAHIAREWDIIFIFPALYYNDLCKRNDLPLDKRGSTNSLSFPNSRVTFNIEREPSRAEVCFKKKESLIETSRKE